MKRHGLYAVLGLAAAVCVPGCSRDSGSRITCAGLLEEMLDPYAQTYLPENRYVSRLWSSYDRASTVPGGKGWYANGDYSQFVRVETNSSGRREGVMVDATGPGAITRLWMTFSHLRTSGVIRFYVDGTCVLACPPEALQDNRMFGGRPLASILPDLSSESPPAVNLYLPILFSRNMKMTYENDGLWEADEKGNRVLFFYNIESRKYASGVTVEPFSRETLTKYEKEIDQANMRLLTADRRMVRKGGLSSTFDGKLPPGRSDVGAFEGPGAIGYLAMNVGRDRQALRDVMIEFTFDGEKTVSAPISQFFGCGLAGASFSQWRFAANADGLMESFWPMPYRKRAVFSLVNTGTNAVTISGSCIAAYPYEWDPERSLHFGASWVLLSDEPVQRNGSPYDVCCLAFEGTGRVVGTTLGVISISPQWWGEGDEKVFVDDDHFPSYFGTGTEDYFGSSFCSTNKFSHPLVAQPHPYGAPGETACFGQYNRIRLLDDIPFGTRVRFLLEVSHLDPNARMTFSPVTYWYMRPGSKPMK